MPPVKKTRSEERQRTFLKEWREHRNLTLEEASERIDVHHTTLGRVEKGQIPYNQDFLERAALAYGCDVEDFLLVNPHAPASHPKLVYDALKNASVEKQAEALRIIQALLKAS